MSMVFPTWLLQMYLSGAWVTLNADVRADQPITCQYGISGSTPADRVADTGVLAFALNNSARNSAATLGYYSPLKATKRAGYDFNVPVRWKLTYGSDSRYKFLGKLSDIVPNPGQYDDRLVPCRALDWMDEAATLDLPDLDVQIGKRGDELVATILDALDADDQPTARSLETSIETYAIALDAAATGQKPKVREVFNQIALSGLEYIYIKGDATTGGVLMQENRHHRALNPTIEVTLLDTMIERQGFVTPGSRDDIYSTVQVFVKPSRIDAAATTVLFSLQTASTLVQPGDVLDTIFGPYRDPSNNDQIGGTAQVAPVATTDYLMNSVADGSGVNLTANFTVTASTTGLGVRFTIVNTGAVAGYITKLQLRGKGIYRYSAVVEVAVPNAYGSRAFQIDMPFQNDLNVGTDVATFLSQILATPFAHISSVLFLANRTATLMGHAIVREPGDRIAVTETVTGLDDQFTINSVLLELLPGGQLYCTWGLEPATANQYWLWGVAGSSEWGVTTLYAF